MENGQTMLIRLLLCASLSTVILAGPLPAQDEAGTAATVANESLLDAPKLPPVSTPPAAEIEASLDRGVKFLIDDQNENGSWGSVERTKDLNIFAPVPGAHHAFRTAVTSLCLCALMELEPERDDLKETIDQGEAWLLEHLPELRRADPIAIYNVWGHAYGIQALAAMHQRYPDDQQRQARIVDQIKIQYDLLDRFESVDGGWGYYDFRAGTKKPATDSTSFVTAAVLVAFDKARDIGVPPPAKLVKRGMASIKRQQKPDFSYLYGEYLKYTPMGGINRPGGSLGRSQACNLALRLWDDKQITDKVLTTWLDRLFARNGWLSIGRKRPVPHESWFAVAGYFFYYGHYYAALCIEQLPEEEQHDHKAHLATILLKIQEKDGSWWDYPLYNYHQQYGTAFALMSLGRCRRAGQ
jgi:hypothetical protein